MQLAVICGLAAFAVTLFTCAVLIYLKHRAAQPKLWVGFTGKKVGVKFLGTAIQPYEGLPEAVHVMQTVLIEKYGLDLARKATDIWVEVYGKDDDFQNAISIHGHREFNGLTDLERVTPFSPLQTIIKIRQLHFKDVATPRPVGASALFHEVVEHWVSYLQGKGWNQAHTDAELTAVSNEMNKQFVIEFGRKP